ncbi:MAG: hypothetical protein KA369_13355 [Spirochaetes bacterium]|nr:hypothetical protein [Spirochaetota bacterium]
MKKLITLTVAAIILAMASLQSAHAIGIALNRQDNRLDMPVPGATYGSLFNRLVDRMVGTKVIFDTVVAKDRLFNYRLSMDCENSTVQKDYIFGSLSYDTNRLTISNTFGFGFFRTSRLRLWAGPQFALSYEFKSKNNTIYDPVIYNKIGPVVGLNIHTGNEITFAIEMGFRAGFGFNLYRSPSNVLLDSKPEPIASIKLIFRAWDFFYKTGV